MGANPSSDMSSGRAHIARGTMGFVQTGMKCRCRGAQERKRGKGLLYVLPDYYPDFHCVAGECEDTCCAGWQIVIDEKSLKKYRGCRGAFRSRMLQSVNWKEKIFCQDKEKRCAFLNEKNLCDLYTGMGAESLCRTCRLYPRHIEEYENVREVSLSVSCPEAARLLLNRQEPMRFLEFWRDREESYEEFDELLYSELTDCRKDMFAILQNRSLPLRLRCGLITGLANDVQKRFDEGKLFTCRGLAERMGDRQTVAVTEQKMNRRAGKNYPWISWMFRFLYTMEYLKEDWKIWLEEAEERLYSRGEEPYLGIEQEFLDWMEHDSRDWQIPFEQLLIYFLSVYFCGAVYDGEILAAAQLGVVHVWLVREMLMAVWLRNGKVLDMEDMQDMVCRYSRELEHSDVNQKAMERKMRYSRLPWLQKDR